MIVEPAASTHSGIRPFVRALGPVIGLDLGGTKLAAVVLDDAGRVLRRSWTEHQANGYEAVLDTITTAVGDCERVVGRAVAVGVAVAGLLDRDRSRVTAALNLGFADRPLRDDLAGRLGRPVTLENDANAAALAEHLLGAGAGARSLVLLTLGTGIGGGIVVDGELVRGGRGAAAELGHLPIRPGGDPCGCGGAGCLEVYVSGTALSRLAGGTRTSRHVVAAADRGDRTAVRLLADAGRCLGDGIAMLIPTLDPDVVVLGGGLAHAAAPHLLPPLRERLNATRPFPAQTPGPDVRLSTCGPESGALGAAHLAGAMRFRIPA
jgi:glucokinase